MSPTLHNWGFGQIGADSTYEAYPLKPEHLSRFMEEVRSAPILGLSVTIPHKRAVMACLDHISPRAEAVGAVNTVYWDNGKLCGENTDIFGLMAPLAKLENLPPSALILGAGGGARAAVAGCRELGIKDVAVSNRTQAKAEAIATDFAIRCVQWEKRLHETPGLICNTTPLGMSGDMANLTPWEADSFEPGSIAYDIVYTPLETRFLREAAQAGCQTLSGLEMFLSQGLAQFHLWTGKSLDDNAARALLLNALSGAVSASTGRPA